MDSTTITPEAFRRLAERLLHSDFFVMEHIQTAPWTDAPSLTIEVRLADGRIKQVTGDGERHREIGAVLDSSAHMLNWHRETRPFESLYNALVQRSKERNGTGTSAP
jgi:hypothetical protein